MKMPDKCPVCGSDLLKLQIPQVPMYTLECIKSRTKLDVYPYYGKTHYEVTVSCRNDSGLFIKPEHVTTEIFIDDNQSLIFYHSVKMWNFNETIIRLIEIQIPINVEDRSDSEDTFTVIGYNLLKRFTIELKYLDVFDPKEFKKFIKTFSNNMAFL